MLLFVILEVGIRAIWTYLLLLILSFNLCIELHFYATCNLPHQSCLTLYLVSSKKSLQAKLNLNEKYEQRPKFFISIECFGCVIMVFVSHPRFMLLLLFLLLYGIHRKMSWQVERDRERERERERESICKLWWCMFLGETTKCYT